jgi:hypothetical protein
MAAPDEPKPPPEPAPRAGLASRLPHRRTWILIGRTLGGFGAFIAAIIAALEFAFGGGGEANGLAPALARPPGTGDEQAYEFAEVTDRSGRIRVEVPTAWGNLEDDGWHANGLPPFADGERIGDGVNAAPNVALWRRDLETPGTFVGVSRTVLAHYSPRDLARGVTFGDCSFERSEPYTTTAFTGETVTWRCPGATRWIVLVATPTASRAYAVLIQTKLVSARDVAAYNRILNTFEVDLV